MQQIYWIESCIQDTGDLRQKMKNLSKSFPFYITEKLSKMQGIAQNLSNKFGVLHGGNGGIFWYNI